MSPFGPEVFARVRSRRGHFGLCVRACVCLSFAVVSGCCASRYGFCGRSGSARCIRPQSSASVEFLLVTT
eukprot:11197481-Lingulodinium_polyedra.AAC.1